VFLGGDVNEVPIYFRFQPFVVDKRECLKRERLRCLQLVHPDETIR
jgi:hypothetical protein